VVDLSLRRGDSLGLIRRIRSQFPQMKMIALSVLEDANAKSTAMEAGANGFVVKRSIATDLLPTSTPCLWEAQRFIIHETSDLDPCRTAPRRATKRRGAAPHGFAAGA